MMRGYFSQRAEEQVEMRRLVEATMAAHQSTREARDKLQAMKQKIGELHIMWCLGSSIAFKSFWKSQINVPIFPFAPRYFYDFDSSF